MRASDVAAVADIERRSQPTPWPAATFADELDRAWAHVDVARAYPAHAGPLQSGHRVALPVGANQPTQPDPLIVGFCDYWLVADELQLLNIAIAPDWRRRGIARLLIDELLAFAQTRACVLITLEVRSSNHPAQTLYRSYGFREVAVRKQYYADNREDALLMDLRLA